MATRQSTENRKAALQRELEETRRAVAEVARAQDKAAAAEDFLSYEASLGTLEALTRKQRTLLARITRLVEPAPAASALPREGGDRSQRDYITDALAEVDEIMTTRAVSAFVAALTGIVIKDTSFPALRARERANWERSPIGSPAWVVPSLSAASLSAMPRFLALSSWAPEKRILGTRTGRVAQIKICLACLRRLKAVPDGESEHTRALRRLVSDYGSTVPGAITNPLQVRAQQVERACLAELDQITALDMDERREAARRLERFKSKPEFYWGLLEVIPGNRAAV